MAGLSKLVAVSAAEGGAVHNRREFVLGKPAASLSEVSPEAAGWKPGATHVNPCKSLSLGLPVLAKVSRRRTRDRLA
jgi:hypothetical protein